MTVIIGLTGRMCAGKSQVEKILQASGVPVLDMDDITKKIYSTPTNQAFKDLVYIFGTDIIQDGIISKQKMRDIFKHGYGSTVEKCLYAEYLTQINEFVARNQNSKFVVFSSSILFRMSDVKCYATWGVTASDEVIMSRLKKRDPHRDDAEIQVMLRRQILEKELIKSSTDIITNNGGYDELISTVHCLIKKYWDIL